MKLSDLKTCVTHVIQGQIGCLKKNSKFRTMKVAGAMNEIDKTIEKWGDVDAGLLYVAGVDMPFLKHDCAERMMKELHNKYPTDMELIEAIDTIRFKGTSGLQPDIATAP